MNNKIKKIKKIIKEENINLRNIINPFFLYNLLFKYRYIHFFITGASGVIINLTLTWYFTNFIFGLKNYFYGYLIGLSVNIIWNFVIHTKINFKVKKGHFNRFIIFMTYTIVLSFIQANIIKIIVPIFGLEYYLFIIGSVILLFSIITFIIFKLWLFKDR